ncbi:hypothetical protein [Mycobacterium shigaense]|uniref:Uncharacterized protein n=1 Tax=Mycobacterium shigaense TaxID=722731 RepID=A0A1Z4EGK9_9MYCO|nr:hypothetical protein [Mycobacterium shigaense]BAX92040.1 hypothetical protein MSG_01887 [Mycobacterium shigaense]
MTTTIQINGAPIYVLDRDNGGVLIMQGSSHVRLSAAEVGALVSALSPRTRTNARILRYPQTKEINELESY